ncbi:MAG: hypothetical protein A2W19_13100 [Spirochaetes bacterium RBG_16_49_21]|nr:MAG: hypothetical protein A2W19_13100 [Spirochaetes bacterium RBG_16_49_21]
MRYFKIFIVLFLVTACVVSCKKKEMSLEDFAKIENDVNVPNPELCKPKVEDVAEKYGYTYQQYKDMFDKVQKDHKLREQLGEIRLKPQKPGNK